MKILSNELPLFPLHTVLFPQARLPLHIFEPRYREMIQRCLENDLAFGVVLIKEGAEVGAPAIPHEIGTTARIVDVAHAADGRMNINVAGVARFQLLEYFSDRPYLTGKVQLLPDENVDLKAVENVARRAKQVFAEYVKVIRAMTETEADDRADDPIRLPKDPTVLSYLVASNLPISNRDKQVLLEARTVSDRLRREIGLIEREIKLARLVTEQGEHIRDQGSFSMN